MQNKPFETQAEKLNRWQNERDAWKVRPERINQDLTDEQKIRYWKERKDAGFSG